MVKERRGGQFDILKVSREGQRTLRIPIPKQKPITPEEITRRRQLFADVMATRDQMEPVVLADLLDDAPEEGNTSNG